MPTGLLSSQLLGVHRTTPAHLLPRRQNAKHLPEWSAGSVIGAYVDLERPFFLLGCVVLFSLYFFLPDSLLLPLYFQGLNM